MRKRIPRCHFFGTQLSRLVRSHVPGSPGNGTCTLRDQLWSRRMTAWDSLSPSSLVVCISIPDPFDKSYVWPAGWESWDQKWSLMIQFRWYFQLPCPPRLPTTMSTTTVTVIMPPNTGGQLSNRGLGIAWPVRQVSWAVTAWFHHVIHSSTVVRHDH